MTENERKLLIADLFDMQKRGATVFEVNELLHQKDMKQFTVTQWKDFCDTATRERQTITTDPAEAIRKTVAFDEEVLKVYDLLNAGASNEEVRAKMGEGVDSTDETINHLREVALKVKLRKGGGNNN